MTRLAATLPFLALLAHAAGPPPARPAPPAKEPAYQTSSPRYAVLTFGRDRVWVVLDGDTLYADRNGDGDLTDKTERKKSVGMYEDGTHRFEFGNLRRVGGQKAQLFVTSGKDGERVSLTVGGVDYRFVTGPTSLRFAGRPQDAPVIPFEGPLRLMPSTGRSFVPGEETSLTVHVGTPMAGGRYVAVDVDWPPADAHPVAEVTFANKANGGPPLRVTAALKQRC